MSASPQFYAPRQAIRKRTGPYPQSVAIVHTMKHKSPLFVALLLLSSCGGAPKDPSAPISPASAAPASEAAPIAEAKTDAPHAAATPVPDATCEKDADCTIFADCCSCRAVSAKAPLPESCDSICGESSCEVKGKTLANVACVAGHCKLK